MVLERGDQDGTFMRCKQGHIVPVCPILMSDSEESMIGKHSTRKMLYQSKWTNAH